MDQDILPIKKTEVVRVLVFYQNVLKMIPKKIQSESDILTVLKLSVVGRLFTPALYVSLYHLINLT